MLLLSAGGHQGSPKAHQADNQKHVTIQGENIEVWGLIVSKIQKIQR